jgi:hypothetical protein
LVVVEYEPVDTPVAVEEDEVAPFVYAHFRIE